MLVTEDYLNQKTLKKEQPSEHNMTTNIMLRSLNLNSSIPFKTFRYFGFQNCYLDDYFLPITSNPNWLFLVFNPTTITKEFQNFQELLIDNKNYIGSYDTELNQVVYIFKVEDKWLPSLEKFKQSKYSEIDKDYVKKYFHAMLPNGDRSKYYAILTKQEWYKKKVENSIGQELEDYQELGSVLYPENEIFRYKKQ